MFIFKLLFPEVKDMDIKEINYFLQQKLISLELPELTVSQATVLLEKVPGTYFFLGSNNPEKGPMYPHHHPKFDLEESVLWIGSAVFARVVFDFCDSFPITSR